MRVLAIIPCYNEESSLRQTIEGLKVCAPDVDFVVINDGSHDNTQKICVDNHYPIINMPFNLGLASAVQTGMKYAFQKEYDMALQFDGDGQHLPEYILPMVKEMLQTSSDIMIGSRYTGKLSLSLRGLGGSLIQMAMKISIGRKLTDPTSGMRLFNRKMIEIFATKMNLAPEPDSLAYLMSQGAKVVEVPVIMQERKAGMSYFNALNSINYMLHMFISILVIQWFRGKEVLL